MHPSAHQVYEKFYRTIPSMTAKNGKDNNFVMMYIIFLKRLLCTEITMKELLYKIS